jgi:hypothetical protein
MDLCLTSHCSSVILSEADEYNNDSISLVSNFKLILRSLASVTIFNISFYIQSSVLFEDIVRTIPDLLKTIQSVKESRQQNKETITDQELDIKDSISKFKVEILRHLVIFHFHEMIRHALIFPSIEIICFANNDLL